MPSDASTTRIAIIGAGPIGLECALYAKTLGHPVTVYERGEVADNVRAWGHIQMFSPWSYNCSPLGLQRLEAEGAETLTSESLCPTGKELAEAYLLPLSNLPELKDSVRSGHQVLSCGRREIGKNYLGANPSRRDYPFRLLLRDGSGTESIEEADVVIDTSGVFDRANWFGEGGIPAVGERNLDTEICRRPPDILGAERDAYANNLTLLVGSGFSAATSVVALRQLQEQAPRTQAVWICRSSGDSPIREIENDTLPSRAELARQANAIASNPPNGFRYLAGSHIQGITKTGGRYRVTVRLENGSEESIACDRIISNIGYRPDESLYRQLQIHECYATLGPMDLAASLLAQGDVDCLAVQSEGPNVLKNPEPGFFILGAKSFGSNSSFLIRLGHEQIAQAFTLIENDPELNLYATALSHG